MPITSFIQIALPFIIIGPMLTTKRSIKKGGFHTTIQQTWKMTNYKSYLANTRYYQLLKENSVLQLAQFSGTKFSSISSHCAAACRRQGSVWWCRSCTVTATLPSNSCHPLSPNPFDCFLDCRMLQLFIIFRFRWKIVEEDTVRIQFRLKYTNSAN